MLIPLFTVFVDKPSTSYQENIIATLIKEEVAYNVDSVNGSYKGNLQHFKNSPHRFYFVKHALQSCTWNELPNYDWTKPSFAVHYSQKEEISDNDWSLVFRYLDNLFFPEIAPETRLITRRAKELLNKPIKMEPHVKPEKIPVKDVEQYYSLQQHYIEEMDIMLCSVEKPNVDLPFVVVIRDYNIKGLKPLFTSLFISKAWGVSRYDVEYLRYLWNTKEMQGEFDIDRMLKEATESCYPSDNAPGDSEPEVYRKEFEQVIKYFRDKPFIPKTTNSNP